MKLPRALILSGFGINCEEEMQAAYTLSGVEAEIVPIKDLFLNRASLFDYDIFNIPGGFSFGDDLGAGKVLANMMRFKSLKSGELFFDELKRFISQGKFVIGICNGFQVLVSLGLLPGLELEGQQNVSLTVNHSLKFEDRWCRLKVPKVTATPLLEPGRLFELPVRHKEGCLVVKDLELAKKIISNRLIALQYVDDDDQVTKKYPLNPNASFLSCAALTNPTGQVLGMMPHPEAFLSFYNHPNWPLKKRLSKEIKKADGLCLFEYLIQDITRSINAVTV